MRVFRDSEKAKIQQAKKEAGAERERSKKLARPLLTSLAHKSPVAVVVLPGAEEKRRELMTGLQGSFPANNILIMNARRVQRLDEEGEFVEETLDKLRSFRRSMEGSKAGSLVVFAGIKYPQPDTIDVIGRGTPEVVTRVTNMINSEGPNDPRFLFIGNGTPEDMPSATRAGFPYDLDRGILEEAKVIYGLHPEHGLQTDLASRVGASFLHPSPQGQQRREPLI